MSFFKKIAKILFATPFKILCPSSKICLNGSLEWFKRVGKLYIILKNFFPFITLNGCMSHVIKKVKALTSEPEAYRLYSYRCIDFFKRIDDDDIKMFIIQVLVLCEVITDDVCYEFLAFANETNNINYKYWITMDVSKYTFLLQKGFYSHMYLDRKELLLRIATHTKYSFDLQGKSSGRLCLICFLMDKDDKNSAHRVASMISHGLSKYFPAIDLVVLDTFSPTHREDRKLTTLYKRKKSKHFHKFHEHQFQGNIFIHYVKGKNFIAKAQSALNIIGSINPKAIIDISDEYSFISYYYSKKIPTFYLPLRNNASSLFYTYILGNVESYKIGNKKYNSISLDKVVPFCFPEYIPKELGTIPRNELGVEEDDFIILSIGNNKTAFCNHFVDSVMRILNGNTKIKWLFVGQPAPDYLHQNYAEFLNQRRVLEKGFENNLLGLCKSCDVLLRGENTGGSGATAIAAMARLPIVMTNAPCDAKRWLGIDYSSIGDYDTLALEITKLFNDKEYYQQRSCLAFEKVKKVMNSDDIWRELSETIKSRCQW